MTTPTFRALWRAVVDRDRAMDGLLVYGVRSTGIACRPSCPSRRPRAERVEFFPGIEMAVAAGYRPCKRCRPDKRTGDAETGLGRACEAIMQRPEVRWTTGRLAKAAGSSPVALRRAFRRVLGLAPRDYVAACRRRRFLDRLRAGASVAAATYDAGYESSSRAYAPGESAIAPASYRRGGLGATIEWMTSASPLGRILVAATARGVCFVAIGASDAELAAAIRHEFPRAHLAKKGTPTLRRFLEAARTVAAGRSLPTSLPADVVGTSFQWRVWRALTRIPRGTTVTYGQLSSKVGRPKAVRAVARACAANPLALLIPCHRVVGSDGALRGYRWGVPVKQRLLRTEALGYHAPRGLHAGIRGEVLG